MAEKKNIKKSEKAGKSKESKASKKKLEKAYEKQIKTAVIIMIVIIFSFIFTYWVIQQTKKFEYHGFKFQIEKEGQLEYYNTLLEYISPYTGEKIPFIIRLKNDPRVLENIPIEGDIILKKNVLFSISPSMENCSESVATLVDFSRTLKAFGINATSATNSRDYAEKSGAQYADCRDAIGQSVILLREGDSTQIIKDKDCYILEFNNCETREIYERFILKFIENSIINRG